jgi:hypothetical protein
VASFVTVNFSRRMCSIYRCFNVIGVFITRCYRRLCLTGRCVCVVGSISLACLMRSRGDFLWTVCLTDDFVSIPMHSFTESLKTNRAVGVCLTRFLWNGEVDIITCMSDYRRGFGLEIGFIDHLYTHGSWLHFTDHFHTQTSVFSLLQSSLAVAW